ncbi:hypothetical protein H6770_03785 [Candidatus Peribacteria bacterium]|nr:hypothetical protein [Candidatus Peribacteria bacterium]
MMENLSILAQNKDFLMNAYNMNSVMGFLLIVAIVDVVFRGFAMWRAARMEKKSWFIALLVINSMAILPIIFLLMTNQEYKKRSPKAP